MSNLNFEGDKIDNLSILERLPSTTSKTGRKIGVYKCQCDCVEIVIRLSNQFRRGKKLGCDTCARKVLGRRKK